MLQATDENQFKNLQLCRKNLEVTKKYLTEKLYQSATEQVKHARIIEVDDSIDTLANPDSGATAGQKSGFLTDFLNKNKDNLISNDDKSPPKQIANNSNILIPN